MITPTTERRRAIILSADRLDEWRDFAAAGHAAFPDDCEMDPMELVGHIDVLQERLDRQVRRVRELEMESHLMLAALARSHGGSFSVTKEAMDEVCLSDVITSSTDPVTGTMTLRLCAGAAKS